MRNVLRSIARSERNGHINLTGRKPAVLVLPSRNREFANFVPAIENKTSNNANHVLTSLPMQCCQARSESTASCIANLALTRSIRRQGSPGS